MAKSVGVIIARVLVALIILAGIGACIYFFVIKNDNVRGAVYEELSKTLASENQNTLQKDRNRFGTHGKFQAKRRNSY